MNASITPHRIQSAGVLRRAVVCGALSFSMLPALSVLPAAAVRAEEGDGEAVRRSGRGRDVTIIAGEDRVIYEVRQNGVLRQIRIVPDNGRPYYLVPADPTRAGEDLSTVDQLIPSWTLIEF